MRPRRATQADVAREAGVSVATVSYVASGRRDRKKAATAEISSRVLAAMEKLDYTPTRAGRVLARSRTGLVAIATSTSFNPRATRMITQVEEVAAERGLGVVVQHYGHTDGAAERIETHLTEGLADAAIVLGVGFGSARLHRIGRKLPVLAIGDPYRPRGYDVLVQHERTALRGAAEYLVGLGVRRPAFVGENSPTGGARQPRREAFQEVLTEHGFADSVLTVRQDPEDAFSGFLDAQHHALELLSGPRRSRPDAIMASSDRAAISTLLTALQLGISVPEELKVIGVGNLPEGARLTPALTTVGNDVEEYRPVLERLIDRIDDPGMATRTVAVPWRLILRDTA